jgi:trimeric autotransporter adhesin
VLPTDYFYEAAMYLACYGVISGYPDGTFHAYDNTTRGQVTKIVVLGFGMAVDTSDGPHFTDVPVDHTFYPYVETAYHYGIVSGYGDGTFRPGDNVTRGQIAKIVVISAMKVKAWTLFNPPIATFIDVPYGSTFYQYIETARREGLIAGYPDGTFRPGNFATRGQIAKITYRAVTASPHALEDAHPAR